jgi:hypothetical protein
MLCTVKCVSLVLLATFITITVAKKRYDNYQIIRLPVVDGLEEKVEGSEQNIRVLGRQLDGVDVLVGPESLQWFQESFDSFLVIEPNVQDHLDEEEQSISAISKVKYS